MTNKDDYSPQEWKALVELPKHAAMSVITSGRSGPIQLVKEILATSKAIDESKASPVPLVAAVATDVAARHDEQPGDEAKPEVVPEQDVAKIKTQTESLIGSVNEILAARSTTEESEAYKRWILEVAQKTAEAAKEGGFLGIGGTQVTAAEQDTIASLSKALGVAVE